MQKKGGGQAKKRKIPENGPERGAVDSQSPAGDNGGNASAEWSGASPKVNGVEAEIKRLEYKATSGIEIIAEPNATTTILGRYNMDTKNIIEELQLPKTTDFSGNEGGFVLLNTPDELYKTPNPFWREYNKPFLDAAISRGDVIWMATPINHGTLYTKNGELTGHGKEYFYLCSKGYELIDGRMVLKEGN